MVSNIVYNFIISLYKNAVNKKSFSLETVCHNALSIRVDIVQMPLLKFLFQCFQAILFFDISCNIVKLVL